MNEKNEKTEPIWLLGSTRENSSILGGAPYHQTFALPWDLLASEDSWAPVPALCHITTPEWLLYHDRWGGLWYFGVPCGGIVERKTHGIYVTRRFLSRDQAPLDDAARRRILSTWLFAALEAFSDPPIDTDLACQAQTVISVTLSQLIWRKQEENQYLDLRNALAAEWTRLHGPDTANASPNPLWPLADVPERSLFAARLVLELFMDLLPPHPTRPYEMAVRIALLDRLAREDAPACTLSESLRYYIGAYARPVINAAKAWAERAASLSQPNTFADAEANPFARLFPNRLETNHPPTVHDETEDLPPDEFFEQLFSRRPEKAQACPEIPPPKLPPLKAHDHPPGAGQPDDHQPGSSPHTPDPFQRDADLRHPPAPKPPSPDSPEQPD
ncbi:MAG: hypothetical protein N2512_00990 [Armatimonadetes bacterium]|nr:hypothetical protein [Armatimonadota bacterium]